MSSMVISIRHTSQLINRNREGSACSVTWSIGPIFSLAAPQKLGNSPANTGLTFSLRKDFPLTFCSYRSLATRSCSLFLKMQQRCVTSASLCHTVTRSVKLSVTRRVSVRCVFVTQWHVTGAGWGWPLLLSRLCLRDHNWAAATNNQHNAGIWNYLKIYK